MGKALERLVSETKSKGHRLVGTRGDTKSRVCIIGEAPGVDEDAAGIPFVGASGREQDKMLLEAGLRPGTDCWFTNPYKVRPPENKISRLGELGVDLKVFEDQFFEELEESKPAVIMSCGKTPTELLCPSTKPKKKGGFVDEKKQGFGKWRGSILISPKLNWPHYVVPVYHPAFVLRNWSERQTSVLIYQRGWEEAVYHATYGTLQQLPEREFIYDPSYDQTVGYMLECLGSKQPISVDIELLFEKLPKSKKSIKYVYIIGLAMSEKSGLAFSLWDFEGARLVRVLRLLDRILRVCKLIGQNFTTFDAHWLQTIGCRTNIFNVDDTLIRHHVLWPELEHKLAFMTMQYTREPYYKDEGKTWKFGKIDRNQLRRYCCKDVAVTYEVWQRQEEEFVQRQ